MYFIRLTVLLALSLVSTFLTFCGFPFLSSRHSFFHHDRRCCFRCDQIAIKYTLPSLHTGPAADIDHRLWWENSPGYFLDKCSTYFKVPSRLFLDDGPWAFIIEASTRYGKEVTSRANPPPAHTCLYTTSYTGSSRCGQRGVSDQ